MSTAVKYPKSNNSSVPHSVCLLHNITHFILLLVICCDPHWAVGTKANPLYITFNQMPYIGLWYRCVNIFSTQGQTGPAGNGDCVAMDPSVQVLPFYLIYTRACVILAIISQCGGIVAAIVAHPRLAPKVKISERRSKKMTYLLSLSMIANGFLTFTACFWYTWNSFSNGLGWMTGSQVPIQFVASYISAWKPAWCLVIGLVTSCVCMCFGFYLLTAWRDMEPFPEDESDYDDTSTFSEGRQLYKREKRDKYQSGARPEKDSIIKIDLNPRQSRQNQPYNSGRFSATQKKDDNSWI